MAGYLSVQSLPRRVRICTLPRSSRACIRYPSNLISCSQSGPSGAFSTSFASCGLTQAGGEASPAPRPVSFARGDFIIATYTSRSRFMQVGQLEVLRSQKQARSRLPLSPTHERMPFPIWIRATAGNDRVDCVAKRLTGAISLILPAPDSSPRSAGLCRRPMPKISLTWGDVGIELLIFFGGSLTLYLLGQHVFPWLSSVWARRSSAYRQARVEALAKALAEYEADFADGRLFTARIVFRAMFAVVLIVVVMGLVVISQLFFIQAQLRCTLDNTCASLYTAISVFQTLGSLDAGNSLLFLVLATVLGGLWLLLISLL